MRRPEFQPSPAYSRQDNSETSSSSRTSVFLFHYHYTNAPLLTHLPVTVHNIVARAQTVMQVTAPVCHSKCRLLSHFVTRNTVYCATFVTRNTGYCVTLSLEKPTGQRENFRSDRQNKPTLESDSCENITS
jgi:hypothetical protein